MQFLGGASEEDLQLGPNHNHSNQSSSNGIGTWLSLEKYFISMIRYTKKDQVKKLLVFW